MQYEWDELKRRSNYLTHGIDFLEAETFQWHEVVEWQDERKDYGEVRRIAMAPIGDQLHVMVYTERRNKIRIISLRRANQREVGYYEETKNQNAIEE